MSLNAKAKKGAIYSTLGMILGFFPFAFLNQAFQLAAIGRSSLTGTTSPEQVLLMLFLGVVALVFWILAIRNLVTIKKPTEKERLAMQNAVLAKRIKRLESAYMKK